MIGQKERVIYLGKNKLTIYEVKTNNSEVKEIGTLAWEKTNLGDVIRNNRKIVGNNIRILVDESWAYVVDINSENLPETRQAIQEIAQQSIPDDLNILVWDFVRGKSIQVVALVKQISEELKAVMVANNIQVRAIEPVSYALARLVKNNGPTVIISGQDQILMTAADSGIVIGSKVVKNQISEKEVEDFISYAQDTGKTKVEKIIVSPKVRGIEKEKLTNKEIGWESIELSAPLGLALKNDLGDKDEKNLILDLGITKKKSNQLIKIIGLGTGGIIVATILLLTFLPKSQEKKKTSLPLITPTQVPTVIPTATPSWAINQVTLSILNGSGRSGEAKKIATDLETNGWSIKNIGNAPKDSQVTLISFKPTVPVGVIDQIDKFLTITYTVNRDTNLDNTAETDVVIIIGKNKK